MRDFTLTTYRHLLDAFSQSGYEFTTFGDYVRDSRRRGHRVVILRHDVDRRPGQAVEMANLEHEVGVRATYFFRVAPESFNELHINTIAEMDHEIGYHYEDLTLARGNVDEAVALFEKNLKTLRSLQPISTICMHGSPLTRWDNRSLWDHVDYRSYGIIGEPYFDVDYEKVLYITDTGRAWNNDRYSLRDRVGAANSTQFASSRLLAESIKAGKLPAQVMLNTHPQRWTDNTYEWGREWLFQGMKNRIKYLVNRLSSRE